MTRILLCGLMTRKRVFRPPNIHKTHVCRAI
jgi:hypothetical protein